MENADLKSRQISNCLAQRAFVYFFFSRNWQHTPITPITLAVPLRFLLLCHAIQFMMIQVCTARCCAEIIKIHNKHHVAQNVSLLVGQYPSMTK